MCVSGTCHYTWFNFLNFVIFIESLTCNGINEDDCALCETLWFRTLNGTKCSCNEGYFNILN